MMLTPLRKSIDSKRRDVGGLFPAAERDVILPFLLILRIPFPLSVSLHPIFLLRCEALPLGG